MNVRVLIAEEDESIRGDLSRALEGNEVFEANCGTAALEALRSEVFSLVITSMDLGDVDGTTLVAQAGSRNPQSLVVASVRDLQDPEAKSALSSGAHDLLVKPLDAVMTRAVLDRAIQRIKLADENRALLNSLKQNVEALGLQNARLEHLATRDELTGLFNYRHFRQALDLELRRCRRHGRLVSLIFADVDHFKDYNDTQGHLAGDALLSTLGRLLGDDSRKTTLVARYGGEEFVFLVPETDLQGALRYAERVRSRVESYPFQGPPVTMSFGVACFPECGSDGNALLNHADHALYRAKASGRNTVCG